MNVQKAQNDGKHLQQTNGIITFLTCNGWRTPKEIWVGFSNGGIEIADMTKRGVIKKIERDNKLFGAE
jgi:hypothetical protein